MFEDKIVEVDKNENYYIIKQLVIDGDLYLFSNMMIDEETPSDDYYIIRVDQSDDKLKMIIVKEEPLLSNLKNKFAESLDF